MKYFFKFKLLVVSILLLTSYSQISFAGGHLSLSDFKEVSRHLSEVSIVGDDSFITKTLWLEDSCGYKEILNMKGGYIDYKRLNSDCYFTDTTVAEMAKNLMNQPNLIKALSINLESLVAKKRTTTFGDYYWVSATNSRVTCITAASVFGDLNTATSGAGTLNGDQVLSGRICLRKPEQVAIKTAHELIDRIRPDGGKHNKLKASGMVQPQKKNEVFVPDEAPRAKQSNNESSTSNADIKERLAKLKKLLDAGLITKEEAAKKRKAILDSL